MKKSIKIMLVLMLSVMMITTITENASAATINWSVVKTPGMQTASCSVKMPVYKGQMTYKVTGLSGNCSYLLGKCVSANGNYCYINNSTKSVMITKINGQQSFYMKFINGGDSNEYMYFICSVEHNAGIGDLVVGSGTISY